MNEYIPTPEEEKKIAEVKEQWLIDAANPDQNRKLITNVDKFSPPLGMSEDGALFPPHQGTPKDKD